MRPAGWPLVRATEQLRDCPQVELKTGETYRGTLVEAEDNWNSQMKDITVTGRVRRRRVCAEPAVLALVRVSAATRLSAAFANVAAHAATYAMRCCTLPAAPPRPTASWTRL